MREDERDIDREKRQEWRCVGMLIKDPMETNVGSLVYYWHHGVFLLKT